MHSCSDNIFGQAETKHLRFSFPEPPEATTFENFTSALIFSLTYPPRAPNITRMRLGYSLTSPLPPLIATKCSRVTGSHRRRPPSLHARSTLCALTQSDIRFVTYAVTSSSREVLAARGLYRARNLFADHVSLCPQTGQLLAR